MKKKHKHYTRSSKHTHTHLTLHTPLGFYLWECSSHISIINWYYILYPACTDSELQSYNQPFIFNIHTDIHSISLADQSQLTMIPVACFSTLMELITKDENLYKCHYPWSIAANSHSEQQRHGRHSAEIKKLLCSLCDNKSITVKQQHHHS